MAAIARICVTPVKGTALLHPDAVYLGANGFEHNRRFHFIDEAGHLVNGKQCGALVGVQCSYDGTTLVMQFSDGTMVREQVALTGEQVETNFYGRRTVPGTVVGGSFGSVVREHVEQSLRLVQVGESGLGVDVHPVTLISTATMEHLQSTVEAPPEHWADRFRMLLELDGLAPYEEESWCGREVTVGEAVLVVGQLVPRCVVTKRNPRTGERDFKTLDALQQNRGGLLLGMYATVNRPGMVRAGDVVSA